MKNIKELHKFYLNAALDYTSKIAALWKEDPLDTTKMVFDIKKSKEFASAFADEIIKEVPVHEVIKAELENAIRSFVINYNKELKEEGSYEIDARLRESTEKESKNYISKAILIFEMKLDGVWEVKSKKVFGFTHASQSRDVKYWATMLYREMFLEFVSTTNTILIAKHNMNKNL